jgi:hypothetical protein
VERNDRFGPSHGITARHEHPRTPRAPESSCLFSKAACLISSSYLVLARLVSHRLSRLVPRLSLVSYRSIGRHRVIPQLTLSRPQSLFTSTSLQSRPISISISRRSSQSVTSLRSRLDRFIEFNHVRYALPHNPDISPNLAAPYQALRLFTILCRCNSTIIFKRLSCLV